MENKIIDPVCKMDLTPQDAATQETYEGKDFYFCSTDCKKIFDSEPQKYAGCREAA